MNFSDKLDASLMRVDFSAPSKEAALREMAALASKSSHMETFSTEQLYAALTEREHAVSTGLGNGLAVPHARLEGLDDFVIFTLVAPRGIEFEALDKRKVHIFFVVFAPDQQVHEHLKILATISRIMTGGRLKQELLKTTTTDVLFEVVSRAIAESDTVSSITPSTGPQKLMLIVLYYEDDLRAVLEYLIDQGIEGATIINAKGMGAYVSTLPLFAGFLSFMREDRNVCDIVLTLVPDGHQKRIIDGIEQITGDLDHQQGTMILSLDIAFSKGTMNMI